MWDYSLNKIMSCNINDPGFCKLATFDESKCVYLSNCEVCITHLVSYFAVIDNLLILCISPWHNCIAWASNSSVNCDMCCSKFSHIHCISLVID